MNTLTPRQTAYIAAYTAPASPSFGNSLQSALSAGYSVQTARNMTHLRPEWLSENIGNLVIKPEQIMQTLTAIIYDDNEPTIIRLKAMELSMRAYNMLQRKELTSTQTVNLSLNVSGIQ